MDRPIYLSDLVSCSPLRPMLMSDEEREKFLREVDEGCKRLYGEDWEERIMRTTILTAEDYGTYINCR